MNPFFDRSLGISAEARAKPRPDGGSACLGQELSSRNPRLSRVVGVVRLVALRRLLLVDLGDLSRQADRPPGLINQGAQMGGVARRFPRHTMASS